MRMPNRDLQTMKYSVFASASIEYAKDDSGNVKTITRPDGTVIQLEVGTTEAHYEAPITFRGGISSSLNPAHAKEYGVDQSSIYSELQVLKGQCPTMDFDTKVWRDSQVVLNPDGTPDEKSADYTVTGMLKEFKHFDFYLLQRVSK